MLVNLNFKNGEHWHLSAVETRYCLMQYLLFEWIKNDKIGKLGLFDIKSNLLCLVCRLIVSVLNTSC